MSDDLKKTLPRIRTFAADFEHDRKESGEPLPPGITVPQAPTPAPTVTPPKTVVLTDVAKKEPAVTINTAVPAFHELKKRTSPEYITTPLAPKAEQKPLHFKAPTETNVAKTVVVRKPKPKDAPKPVSTGGATIITDNKRSQQSLIPAVIAAVRAWFKKVSADSKQKKTPKYTVVDTERRKGVIQKATTKTGTIFTADRETLKDEIRRRSWKQSADEADAPDITWSPNTEVGYPLLDSGLPKPTNITVEFKKRADWAPVPPPVPAPIAFVPPPVFVEPTIPEPVVVPEPAPMETVVATPPTIVEPAEEVSLETLVPVEEEEEIETDYALTTPEAHYRIRSIGDVTKLNTNILSIGVVGIIAGIVVVIIVGRALVGIIFEESPTITVAPATPIGISTSVTDVTLDTPTQEALLIALQQLSTSAVGPQEYRIVYKDGTPLQKSVLLPLLGFANTGSLSQTINEVHILQNQSARSLIFTVTDATTAFGSLLAWESYMVDNLGSLLNISRPNTTLEVSDRTIQNKDVRIFTGGDQEVLVYGFTSANKVLITKDVPTFTAALVSQ